MSRLSLKNDFKDGDILYGEQLNTNNDATMEAVNDNYEKILSLQELKEDVVNVDSKLEGKVDVTAFNDAVNSINSTKADKSEVALKADKSELANKADISYVNNQLTNKADVTYVNTQMNTKADKSALGDLNSLKTNTKTSAVAAINELVDNGSGIKDIDNISITKNANEDIQAVAVMNRNNTNKAVRTWTGTREEYDALENKDANTLYYITDEPDDYEVKANKTLTINELSTDEQYPSAKAVYNSLKEKVDATYVNNQLALKADKADTYTKDETTSAINSAITGKADTSYVNNQLATKANASDLGNLSQLQTNDKTSVVAAINEVLNEGSKIKNIDNLSITSNENNEIQTVGVIDVNNNTSAIKTWTGTIEEYATLEIKNNNTLYYITDDYEEPEVISNKVNTIDASSTNEQYPSAKAVYDSIQGITPGGSNDYNDLNNKPQINGVTLTGNKTSADLGIKQDYTADDITFTDGETFQQKYNNGELTGPQGPQGLQGEPGQDGEQGPAGYTPQKGVDYFTQQDIDEIVQTVLTSLPNGDEVSY